MRVVILTQFRRGGASSCLPALLEHPDVDVARIVFALGQYSSRARKLRRDLKKVRRIGPLGAAVGYYMRRWYRFEREGVEDLFELGRRHGIPVETSPRTNAPRTRELFERSGADLGLSLGNGWISPRVFRIPKHGMINIHGEVLPRFQGAASIVWPIYEGVLETGFTIHQIKRAIDAGEILYQEKFPIVLESSLSRTVRTNLIEMERRIPAALARVVGDYESFLAVASVQKGGDYYTTPTFRQFLRMLRQHRRLRKRERG